MPRKVVDGLEVAVPTARGFFGGGLDNPAAEEAASSGSGGAIRSGKRKDRQSARRARFAKPWGATAASSRQSGAGSLASAAPAAPEPGPPTLGLSGPMAGMDIADAPISTRTRLRKKLGFPLPPTGALAVLERSDAASAPERKMEKMSVAAAKQRGAADAQAAAAAATQAAKARTSRAAICKWMNIPDPARPTAEDGASSSPVDASTSKVASGSGAGAAGPAAAELDVAAGPRPAAAAAEPLPSARKGRLAMLPVKVPVPVV